MHPETRPTKVRYLVVGLTTCVAVLLYVDRFCLGFVAPYIRENLGLSRAQISFVLDAFFYTYAFGQIPCGWLADRFGARLMLAIYLAIWSALTGLMGLAHGLTALLLFRLGCGLFESGAYPAAAGLIRRWVPYQRRGLASGVVSLGGRIGGAVVPVLTAFLMVSFVPISNPSWFQAEDLLDVQKLAADLGGNPPLPEGVDVPLGSVLQPRIRAFFPAETLDVLDTIANTKAKPSDQQREVLTSGLNKLLAWPDLVQSGELEPFRNKLPSEALALSKMTRPLTTEELARRNRLVLELAYPEAVRKIYGEGWRPALLIYGGAGLVLAVVFWLCLRDSPRQHPLANEAEARLVEESEPATTADPAVAVPASVLWRGILTSRSLWLSAFVQFGTNFGWIFLGNLFPTYLVEAHQVPELERGWLVTLPFLLSLPMMIVGGWWTDAMTRRLGPRWGRCLPLASTRLIAAAAFFACLFFNAPLPITAALCIFSVVSDMGIPAIWAFNLDVGGKNVGLVLGWGNMWGNLGAAVSTSTLVFLQTYYGWNTVFLTCGIVFLVIGVASFGIDATKPIGGKPAG